MALNPSGDSPAARAGIDLDRAAHEHAAALRTGEYSARSLAEATLARIRVQEPALNAYITITDDEALAQADAADERLRAGDAAPLTGIPLALKDVLSTKGVETTAGSRILDGFVPIIDCTVVARLREQGAVFVGKANMDEFAMGSSTEHSAFGPTRNPWDLDRVPGGSSGGSAATVAAGAVAISLGTDTGGSIRQPAALTGILGLKPTYGRVSRYGVVAFASSLEQVGPFGRDARDLATLLQAIAGHDPSDSTSAETPVPDYTAALEGGLDGLRVGVPAQAAAEGVDGRRPRGLRAGGRRARARGRAHRSRRRAALARRRAVRLLHHRAGRGVGEPRQIRWGEVRLQLPRRPVDVGRDGADARSRVRGRGQAPDHDRHLRALGRLLRRPTTCRRRRCAR